MAKKLTHLAFTEHARYLTKGEKRDAHEQHRQGPGKKFVPSGAQDFLQGTRQIFLMKQTADDVFEDFKCQRKPVMEIAAPPSPS